MNLCNHPWAVSFNRCNGVVQCHVCGHVWVPLAAENDESYCLAVEAEEERLKHAEPSRDVHGEWLLPATYRKSDEPPQAAPATMLEVALQSRGPARRVVNVDQQ